MNTLTSSRPRLMCRLARSSHALFDRIGARHFARCSDCQLALRAAEQLESELRRTAAVLRQTAPKPSPDLERSILRAAREAKISPAPGRSWSFAWAAGAALAVATVVFVQRGPTPLARPASTSAEAIALIEEAGDFAAEFTDTVIPSAAVAVANNPLQQELGSVYADARSALHFLALNFLPPTALAPESKSESPI